MFLNCYQGRRVLVTGHTGFKGSWLVAWLMQLGAHVAGVSNGYVSEPCHFKVLGLGDAEPKEQTLKPGTFSKKPAKSFIHGKTKIFLQNQVEGFTKEQEIIGEIASFVDYRADVRDLLAIEGIMQDFKPEIVFHLAAQALVRSSYAEPVDTFTVNAMGTLHVLEAVRQCSSVKAVICITSDKAYRNDEWVWGYRETDHLGGEDPYSASKGCAEFVANSYFKSFFKGKIAAATTRAGNVIGGGDWAQDRIIPDCARAWSQGVQVDIRSPGATRPWQHVLEPLSGYLWLGAKLYAEQLSLDQTWRNPMNLAYMCAEQIRLDQQGASSEQNLVNSDQNCVSAAPTFAGQAFNFGPSADASYSVGQVVQALATHWTGFSSRMDVKPQLDLKECTLLKLCCDKSLAYLQWHSTLNFAQTMQFTAAWYVHYYQEKPANMFEFTLNQINQYVQLSQTAGLAWSLHA